MTTATTKVALTEAYIDEALRDFCHYGYGKNDGILYHLTSSSGRQVSFYFSYSGWDGRCLHIHHQQQQQHHPDNMNHREMWTILAQICRRLGCTKLTWRDSDETTIPGAKFMTGWRTVHWMCWDEYLKKQLGDSKCPCRNDIIRRTLENQVLWERHGTGFLVESMRPALKLLKKDAFCVTLATEKDVSDIYGFIGALAKYRNEPNESKNTEQDLRQDGFGEKRLYYCFLLKGQDEKTCGMALFYLGPDFVYMVSLYVDDCVRGKGGGTLLISAMAMLASFLGYPRVVWQVLVRSRESKEVTQTHTHLSFHRSGTRVPYDSTKGLEPRSNQDCIRNNFTVITWWSSARAARRVVMTSRWW